MSPAHPLGGGRGERVHRDAGELIAQPPELAVLGPEIVPPLADAVRLVDGDEPHAAFAQEAAQAIAALADEPLRRHVEQPARIGANPRQHLVALRQRQRAVQVGGRHAIHPKAVDLILHQRDQRRNDQRHAAARRRAPVRSTTAGAWKHSDLPPPVGSTTTLSRPSRTACIASRCSGRKSENPQTR